MRKAIKASVQDYRTVKQEAKGKVATYKGKTARVMVRESRSYYRATKVKVKDAKHQYKQVKRLAKIDQGEAVKNRLTMTKAELKKARLEARVGKRVNRDIAKQVRGTTLGGEVVRRSHHLARSQAESLAQDNDYLEDIARDRQKIRQVKNDLATAKRLSRYTIKTSKTVTKETVKGGYSLANRTYNYARGQGFKRTERAQRWETQLKNHLKKFRMRLAQTKAGQATATTTRTVRVMGKSFKWVAKPIWHVLTNPLSLSSYLLVFCFLFLLVAVMSLSGTVEQDEFDLNESWLLMSKLDREKSTDKVDYWTNIDDVLFYMNYRYGGFTLNEVWPDKKAMHPPKMSDALKDIWDQLNKDKDQLQTMPDLYEKGKSWLKLSKEDLAAYKEALKEAEEYGRYVAYQDLENPLYTEKDEAHYTSPLVITDRFGYTSKKEIKTSSTIKANHGQDVLAAMGGRVTVKDNQLMIESGDSRLTYHHLIGKRFKTGDQVEPGELLGKNNSGNGLELTYEKLNDEDKWEAVNIGFYFERVTYNQTTSVLSDLDFDGASSGKFLSIYERIKKKEPKATIKGVSAMLGNYETESGTNPKRAENEINHPATSPSSWDDPAWLSIGEPRLYGGRFPNIKRRGLGLGQWTDTHDGSNRHTLLLEFAKKKGKKWYDLDLQIDFMLEGDAPYYRQILREILTSNDDQDALTKRFLNLWEGNPGDKLQERMNNARQIADYLKQPSRKGKPGHPFNVPYKVLQPYGKTPWSQGGGAWMYPKGRHDGVDLVAVSGNFAAIDVPVFSLTNGKVAGAWGTELGGYAIVIQADFGGYIYYGHLKYHPTLKVGTPVKQGDQIAVLGNTGAGGIYHIHLQYTQNSVNPLDPSDRDPSFLILDKGTLVQDQIIRP